MAEQTPRTLNHFSLYRFTDAYWSLDREANSSFRKNWLPGLCSVARSKVRSSQEIDPFAQTRMKYFVAEETLNLWK